MTVKQVGPALVQPTTIVALEAVVNDWLTSARIPSWPGILGDSTREAADTSAVRPVQIAGDEALGARLTTTTLHLTGGVQILVVRPHPYVVNHGDVPEVAAASRVPRCHADLHILEVLREA